MLVEILVHKLEALELEALKRYAPSLLDVLGEEGTLLDEGLMSDLGFLGIASLGLLIAVCVIRDSSILLCPSDSRWGLGECDAVHLC